MYLEKILGTDTGKEAFYKSDRNFDKIKTELEGINVSGDAVDINYDNAESELEAENVQEAIDELKELNNYLDANKADEEHEHTKSDITDFPSSLPANGGNSDTVDTMHIWVGAEESRGTDANTIYFCY
jgi:hypothetical protein